MNLNIRSNKHRLKQSRRTAMDQDFDDDTLAPVMPAIDVVQQLIEEEKQKQKKNVKDQTKGLSSSCSQPGTSGLGANGNRSETNSLVQVPRREIPLPRSPVRVERTKELNHSAPPIRSSERNQIVTDKDMSIRILNTQPKQIKDESKTKSFSLTEVQEAEDEDQIDHAVRNPLMNLVNKTSEPSGLKRDEYEFVPKSVILDVYSNDPEVKRFLKQLPRIFNESGYNEQDYKCYSCRRPVGLVFGQSRLCHFDGHHYCSECHLSEKSVIPSRILCNWDFNRYPVSKRNQHFLTLISNEPMFELKKMSPKLYEVCPELEEIEELRRQAFFVRSYCTTCVQESISFELTKLVWPREHLIKQTDLYSLEDLIQIKSGSLKQVLKNVITFGKQHVLSCVLCCQKGFICEICKSSQIIYPFDTESVHRCNACQSIYHKTCFKSRSSEDSCPRCQRLKARRDSKDRP
uniref:Pleckstrin y domain-containing family M member 3 n=1 Tax=Aceria tosichella TaxID=561515 RepID=A0A6G1SF69_9ACAR